MAQVVKRLQTRPQFQAVLAGLTLARTAHFALHHCSLETNAVLFDGGCVWLGAMAPKRWAKRAVTRNAIKRQIYNLGVEHAAEWSQGAWLVRLRSTFNRTQFVSATSELLKAVVRAELKQLFARGRIQRALQSQPADGEASKP